MHDFASSNNAPIVAQLSLWLQLKTIHAVRSYQCEVEVQERWRSVKLPLCSSYELQVVVLTTGCTAG